MLVVIASVQHSGTHFVKQHLLSGWPEVSEPKQHSANAIYQEHVVPESLLRIRAAMKCGAPCIVPLRHPVKVALSWKARGLNLAHFTDQFRRLVTAVDPLGPLYLPLDVPDREDYLARICERLGINFYTEWPIVHSCGKQGRFEEGADTWLVEDIQDELAHFFGRFYD